MNERQPCPCLEGEECSLRTLEIERKVKESEFEELVEIKISVEQNLLIELLAIFFERFDLFNRYRLEFKKVVSQTASAVFADHVFVRETFQYGPFVGNVIAQKVVFVKETATSPAVTYSGPEICA